MSSSRRLFLLVTALIGLSSFRSSGAPIVSDIGGLDNYADAAALSGATTASDSSHSVNPAALAWSFPQRRALSLDNDGKQVTHPIGAELGIRYSGVFFQEGLDLHVFSQTASYAINESTALRLTAGEVGSNHKPENFGFIDGYQETSFRLDLAKRIGGWALGLSAGYTDSAESSDLAEKVLFSDRIEGFGTFRAYRPEQEFFDFERHTFNLRIGLQREITKRLLLGAVVDFRYADGTYITHPLRYISEFPGFSELGIPAERRVHRFPGRTRHWVGHIAIARIGAAWNYFHQAPSATGLGRDGWLHLDYQTGGLNRFDGETFNLLAGASYPITSHWDIAAGGKVDNHKDLSWSAGLSWKPTAAVSVSAAYQHEFFPFSQYEYGHSSAVSISAQLLF